MYIKRLQIENYGPIQDLDISFPFDGENPKPVLLVGENGAGKTIALSHIVNAMVLAKDEIYPDSKEMNLGRTFKFRSSLYISRGAEHYHTRSDFESGIFVQETHLEKPKYLYAKSPMGKESRGSNIWDSFNKEQIDDFRPCFPLNITKNLIQGRCLLYFPSNRAEEPAWLNEKNLRIRPQYMKESHIWGTTRRRIIARSPLRDIHNWLYDVAYDHVALERQYEMRHYQKEYVKIFKGFYGEATNIYRLVLETLQIILSMQTERTGIRFGISPRHNRVISLESSQGELVPNLFQLSSGEMALLTLFLSILRDFDLRENREVPFERAEDVKGIVVVDEIDLHLHSVHQQDVLPKLIRMFPGVQFVMTTHSPLFILGMEKAFGEDSFHVYDLPSGSRISPENFGEFKQAFLAFKATSTFLKEIQRQIQETQHPMLYVEGTTDARYLQRAAKLLKKEDILEKFEVQSVNGIGELRKIWKNLSKEIPDSAVKIKVVLLHDPESTDQETSKGKIYRRKMPRFEEHEHPISKGVEHLFDRKTLEKIRQKNSQFIDIINPHLKTERGKEKPVPESWSINEDEKNNLCRWLCNEGTADDFRHFKKIFDTLEQIVCIEEPPSENKREEEKSSSDA